jgi:hypothetical protein
MTDKPKKIVKRREFEDFRVWLGSLNMINPTLHVNGAAHPGALLTVDFGTPLIEQKLDPVQSAELVSRMRVAAKSLLQDKETNVRVQNDGNNGIWWASAG